LFILHRKNHHSFVYFQALRAAIPDFISDSVRGAVTQWQLNTYTNVTVAHITDRNMSEAFYHSE